MRSDRGRALAGVAAAALFLQLGAAGCICGRPRFLSLEGPKELRVVERSWSSQDYDWIVWPVPMRYELVRPGYRLKVRTHASRPYLAVRAFDPDGNKLDVWDPNQPYLRSIPRHLTSPYPKEGSWSFDVKRDGEVIGSETIHYKVRSRPLACGWHVEF